jgi:hypothetical protein
MNGYGARRQAKRDAAFVSWESRVALRFAAALHNFVSAFIRIDASRSWICDSLHISGCAIRGLG